MVPSNLCLTNTPGDSDPKKINITIAKQKSNREDEDKNYSIKITLAKSFMEKNLLANCNNKP